MKRSVLPLLGAAFAVSACASSAPVYDPLIPFDAASTGVTAFAVPGDAVPEKAVGIDVPTDYSAISSSAMNQALSAVPGASVGAAAAGGIIAVLIIAAVDAGIDADRNGKINKLIADQKFDAKSVFYAGLKSELEKRGYTVTIEQGAGASAAPGTGAVLDVSLSHYGFRISGISWVPSAAATVTVRSASGELLLKDTVALAGGEGFSAIPGLSVLGGDSVIMPYHPRYFFKDVDSIVSGDPAVSVGALKFALESTATGVAQLVGERTLPAAPVAPVAEATAVAAAADPAR